MELEKIITLASAPVRLRLLAMIRSLRATGCQLPVLVIPYDDRPESRFALPEGCEWWELPELLDWVREIGAHPMVRKYQCFLTGNYQYVEIQTWSSGEIRWRRWPAKRGLWLRAAIGATPATP